MQRRRSIVFLCCTVESEGGVVIESGKLPPVLIACFLALRSMIDGFLIVCDLRRMCFTG